MNPLDPNQKRKQDALKQAMQANRSAGRAPAAGLRAKPQPSVRTTPSAEVTAVTRRAPGSSQGAAAPGPTGIDHRALAADIEARRRRIEELSKPVKQKSWRELARERKAAAAAAAAAK